MSYYLTPIKQVNHKLIKSNTQNKPQDWICMICNNLNFSFRKKCNRCKIQTRLQNGNQVASTYSQYYYEQHLAKQILKTPMSSQTNLYTPQTKKENGNKIDHQIQKDINMSRLAKHYWPKDFQTDLQQEYSSTRKEKFANEFWQYINVQDFDQVCQQPQNLGDQENKDQNLRMEAQLQQMFNRILLDQK